MKNLLPIVFTAFVLIPFLSSPAFCQTGSISGNVTSGSILLDGFVKLIPISVQTTTKTTPISSGTYTFSDVADGSYMVQTFQAQKNGVNYVDEIYSDVSCNAGNCPVLLGTSITVTLGGAVSNIDFDLQPGSEIKGSAVGPSGPTTGLTAYLFNQFGGVHASTEVNSIDGTYAFSGLGAGTYYLGITSSSGLIPELHGDVQCMLLSCNRTASTPITIAANTITPGIDFTLDAGSQISGLVVDELTGAPIPNARVEIVSSVGSSVSFGETDASGVFLTRQGISNGTYYAYATSHAYFGKHFNNVACHYASCFNPDFNKLTPILVTSILDVTGVDFSLLARGVGKPDLRGSISSAKQSGGTVNVTYKAVNSGTNLANVSVVRFYLSRTKTLDRSARAFHQVTIPPLAPTNSSVVITQSSPRRRYQYIIATIDQGKKVSELNERNNTTVKRISGVPKN